jgi:hypothetical protein
MTAFPTGIFVPRTTENQSGVTYDASRTKEVFAEDYSLPAAEIVAIETILGTSPEGASATVSARIAAIESLGLPAKWYEGAGAPSTTHNNGDLYLNTTNGDVYQQAAGAWGSPVGNIKGATGSTGSAGSNGSNGTNGSAGATGPAGPANTVYGAADGSTITFNIDTNGGLQSVTLGGNRTLAFTITTNRVFSLILKQDGTGSRTVTWPAGIIWAGGSAPTLTTTLNKSDCLVLIRTGSGAYIGMVAGQNI